MQISAYLGQFNQDFDRPFVGGDFVCVNTNIITNLKQPQNYRKYKNSLSFDKSFAILDLYHIKHRFLCNLGRLFILN